MKNRLIPLTLIVIIGCIGCGPDVPSKQFTTEELGKMADDRLKAIATNTSLSDAECFKKYFDSHPAKPIANLPESLGVWWSIKSESDGYTIHIKDVPNPFQQGESVEARINSERIAIKAKVELCRQVLRHFEARKIRSVTVSLYAQLTGDAQHTELFRVTATQADLPKLEKAGGDPDAGTVFDPRGSKIAELWTVEINRYVDVEYRKK